MTLEKPASKLGTYELLKEQPGIGVGSVWTARTAGDTAETPALFSVVRVHKHLTKKPDVADGVIADTKLAAAFRHPNVVGLVEAGNSGGELYLAFDHYEGESLSALVAVAGAQGLPQPIVLRIALDVLAALAAAYENEEKLFHGELGPQHVLVGADGVTRLGGLESARVLSRLGASVGVKNQDRLSYAAPERVKSLVSPSAAAPPLAATADLFSMGVLLWELLSRQRLFTSKIDAAIVQKVLTGPIAALGTIAGLSVPAPLEEAVKKALERDPASRTASAKDLAAVIEGLGDGVASPSLVAAEVEKLAGKAIAARKAEVRTEIGRRASSKGASTIPPPAAPRAGVPTRKATLLGIVNPVGSSAAGGEATKPVVKPAPTVAKEAPKVEAPRPAAESPKPADVAEPAEAAPPKPAIKPPPPAAAAISKGALSRPVRPPAESMNLEDVEVASSPATAPPPIRRPPPPARRTMLFGTEADMKPPPGASAEDREKKTVAPPKPAVPKPATAAEGAPAPAPEPAHAAEGSANKTSATPATDGKSPGGKNSKGLEKVGPGSTLGRYEILMPVARGGMASVWAAKLPGSRGFQKIFAIKTMLPDVSDDPEFESMFLDEARVAARIRHPNVVEIIDLGEQDTILYIVMEWVDGENLGALVKAARSHGGVPMPLILRIGSQICAGLHAAHELRDDDGNMLDLVHRDISPANVLVSTSGFVKIVDFGIAKSKGRLHVTRVGGTVKGKTPYLSPEQLGQQPLDRRSDLFSLGVLLYVLSTGLHPFRGETDSKTIENIALRDPVPLRAIAAAIPAEFEAIVMKVLAKEAGDRYASAGEMQRALDHAAATLGYSTTEEDVAAFVRKALGESLGKRSQELRATVERADGRAPADGEGSKPSMPVAAVTASAGLLADLLSAPADKAADKPGAPTPPPPEAAKGKGAADGAAEAKAPGEEAAPATDAAGPPDGEEVSFEAAAASLPKPKHPNAVTLPDIDEAGDKAAGEGSGLDAALFATPPRDSAVSRPSSTPDTDGASLELEGLRPRRKPVALIAVGAVLALCVIIGGIALLSGGKGEKDAEASKAAHPPAATTDTRTGTTTPPAPETVAAPAPTPTPAPAPSAPEPTATQAAAEPPAPAPEPPAPPVAAAHGHGTKTTSTTHTSKKPRTQYNPDAP